MKHPLHHSFPDLETMLRFHLFPHPQRPRVENIPHPRVRYAADRPPHHLEASLFLPAVQLIPRLFHSHLQRG
ncbi:hypothetical protein T484DRAFT_1950036 [Baffinella frigidus]|nr:hypothetical protein T484DRAFT_1950036 [Cryptophyta sp. CCMP2293]